MRKFICTIFILNDLVRLKCTQHGKEKDFLYLTLIWPTCCTPIRMLEHYLRTNIVALGTQVITQPFLSFPSYSQQTVYAITDFLVKFSASNIFIVLNNVSAKVMYNHKIKL